LDAIRDIIYQVIPKLLFKNNKKKVSVRTQQKAIFTGCLSFLESALHNKGAIKLEGIIE
jgi:hypothetical protein